MPEAKEIIDNIKKALGNPSSGTIADAMPIIERSVKQTCNPDPVVEQRIVKPAETRKDTATKAE